LGRKASPVCAAIPRTSCSGVRVTVSLDFRCCGGGTMHPENAAARAKSRSNGHVLHKTRLACVLLRDRRGEPLSSTRSGKGSQTDEGVRVQLRTCWARRMRSSLLFAGSALTVGLLGPLGAWAKCTDTFTASICTFYPRPEAMPLN